MEEIAWFEAVCAEVNTNPQRATQQLIEFRESDKAFSVVLNILSVSNNPAVQFHGLSVLQHALVKRWEFLQPIDKETLKSTLWSMILSPRNAPTAVTNKALQACDNLTRPSPRTCHNLTRTISRGTLGICSRMEKRVVKLHSKRPIRVVRTYL